MSFFTQAAAIIFKTSFSQKIGKLEIDILDSVGIDEKTSITDNPIEGGFNTDNAQDDPTEISFNGRMSAFSIKNSFISKISSIAFGKSSNRLKDAHDELYRIRDDKEPITLVTKYKSYDNMLMSSLSFPRDAGNGEELRFNVTFKEIRIAESQLISVDNSKISKDSAKKLSNFGRQVGGDKVAAPALKPSNITLGQFVKSLF